MTLRHETVGEIEIDDESHELQCLIKLGSVKGELTDYVEGFIIEKRKKIIKEHIIHLKKDGGILKSLRMSPNGRISEMADDCYQFIHEEHESERKFSESIKK